MKHIKNNNHFTAPTLSILKMKYILFILFAVSICITDAEAQVKTKSKTQQKAGADKTVPAAEGPAGELMSFEKFFKKTMKITPGEFPVYQDGSRYLLEIPATALNADILVIGDIARGYANNVAQSSGVIRFSKGTGNNLNVTKEVYKEAASPDFNQGIEGLVQKSNLIPISFVMPAEASGKQKGSYIIDITRQLMEGGDLFSFKDFNGLSNSDAARSGVQQVHASQNGVMFSVLRTQTEPGNSMNGSKAVDRAVAFLLNLVIQKLPASNMKVREADVRVGFGTVNYNDFGKNPYGVRNVKVITKWNMAVKAADWKKYSAGELVEPVKAVKIFIDPSTPALFVPYIKQAVEQWNTAFESAGFKNALVMATDEQENWLSSGKIQIKWGNAANGVATNVVNDPRSGEILAAKMNIGDNIVNDLLPSYFAKCGFKDPRVMKNLYDPEVRGEIMRYKVAQALGELLGMVPNLHGSAAYTPKQLRSAAFLKEHSFSSSVTDETEFNYLVQPEDKVAVADLMPRVSTYDHAAIGWAYRVFADRAAEKKALAVFAYSDPALLFLEESKNDPFTAKSDLSSDLLEASVLGMKNVERFYPQVEKLTAAMDDKDEDWSNFKLLSNAFQKSYQVYTNNVLSYIGGVSLRPVLKGYNDEAVVFTSKKEQQKAMALLDTWFFNGVPAYMQSKKMNLLNIESEDSKMMNSTQDAMRKLISLDVLNNLIKAEYALGKDAYRAEDLFADLDHYIFKDFNMKDPVKANRLLMQTKFVHDLADAVAKNNITGGLNDANEVLHLYFVNVMEHFAEMGEQHQDLAARAHYKMIRTKIERDMNQKPN